MRETLGLSLEIILRECLLTDITAVCFQFVRYPGKKGTIMASKTIVEVIDDLDGSRAEETVRFAIDGAEYEVDLSGAHSKKLRDALKPFVEAGRKVGRTRSSGRRTGAATDGMQSKAIRDWAKQHGLQVSDRGRVSAEIQQAYNDAH